MPWVEWYREFAALLYACASSSLNLLVVCRGTCPPPPHSKWHIWQLYQFPVAVCKTRPILRHKCAKSIWGPVYMGKFKNWYMTYLYIGKFPGWTGCGWILVSRFSVVWFHIQGWGRGGVVVKCWPWTRKKIWFKSPFWEEKLPLWLVIFEVQP